MAIFDAMDSMIGRCTKLGGDGAIDLESRGSHPQNGGRSTRLAAALA
jgi:hypothetical protein